MKINADLHTHTVFSHGKNTIEENVRSARKKGLKKIVISDHGSGHLFYGVDPKDWVEMRKEVNRLQKVYPDMEILLGVEANVVGLDGSIDVSEEQRKLLDTVYVGYHYGIKPRGPGSFLWFYIGNGLAKLLPFLRKPIKRMNTRALIRAMDRSIDMITHPGAKIPVDLLKVAKVAQKKGVILEINAHHHHLNTEELNAVESTGVNFAINSDAHRAQDVGRVEDGIDLWDRSRIKVDRIVNRNEECT